MLSYVKSPKVYRNVMPAFAVTSSNRGPGGAIGAAGFDSAAGPGGADAQPVPNAAVRAMAASTFTETIRRIYQPPEHRGALGVPVPWPCPLSLDPHVEGDHERSPGERGGEGA